MGYTKDYGMMLRNIARGIVPTAALWTADAPIEFAFLDDGGAFTDETADANSAAAGDVQLMPAAGSAVNDAFYFGAGGKFGRVTINISLEGTVGFLVWEYWNGAAWVTLPCVDGTTLFGSPGTNDVTFTTPADWASTTVNGQNAFWIRARCTLAYTQEPAATQIWIHGSPGNLEAATDGDLNTCTDIGIGLEAGATDIGSINIDMGVARNVMVSAIVGTWSTTGSIQVRIQPSDDGITYRSNGANNANRTITSEAVIHLIPGMIFARYFRILFTASAAMTGRVKIYEIMIWEVGV